MTAPVEQPLTRGHKKKQRTRRQLLAAAIDVIAERGEAFSVSDITRRAGVANGTFYNYFDDRDALVDAVVPEVVADFAAQSASLVEDDDPVHRFATITALMLRNAALEPDRIRALLRLDAVQLVMLEGTVLSHLRADVAAAVEAGRFEGPVDDAALHVVVGTHLLAARRVVEYGPDEAYDVRLVAQLLRSFGIDPESASSVAARAVAEAWHLLS